MGVEDLKVAAVLRGQGLVKRLDVCGLSTNAWSAVDDLAAHLSFAVVDNRHRCGRTLWRGGKTVWDYEWDLETVQVKWDSQYGSLH